MRSLLKERGRRETSAKIRILLSFKICATKYKIYEWQTELQETYNFLMLKNFG
jgi:hypothetical protein